MNYLININGKGNNLIMNRIRIKKLGFDFSANILASLIVTVTMQILIYPLIAKSVPIGAYGLILTIMGIVNTIVMALGGTLNNIRLIRNEAYESLGVKGDFKVILVVITSIGAIATLFIIMFLGNIGLLNIVLLIFTVILGIVKSYYIVDYRLNLNFKLNLFCNVIIAFGYIAGLMLFFLTNIWVLAFFTAELFGCIFLFFTTKIVKEPMKTTAILKETVSIYVMLIFVGAMATMLTYMDRLIIFPLLGGQAVTIFTVASFFGKSLGLIMTPIASVLLGYYANKDVKFSLNLFWLINILVIVFSAIFFGISCIISSWFTGLLYPQFIEIVQPYILVANLAAIIGMAGNMTQPAVLKYAPMFWQLIVQIVYGTVYISLGIFMLKGNGIAGFCTAIMLANIFRLILLYALGHIYVKKRKDIGISLTLSE